MTSSQPGAWPGTRSRTKPGSRRRGRVRLAAVASAVLVAGLVPGLAFAGHPTASLPDSDFEIDEDANFTVDDTAPPSLDWNNVVEARRADLPTGQSDDSYKGGVKEDTACPNETTGSIPNNKSDLRAFGVYEEEGDPGFLHMYWTRVNDPSGTTLMDFEFNQSGTACAAGPNVLRTAGDFLIEYSIDQGGARADITIRKWVGSATSGSWGPADPLDPTEATGTINSSVIEAENTGGVADADLQARTFGEASIDLDVIFDDESCQSFGSAMLKSRASDSFTSQLKDFIRPVPITLTNCGGVIIRKETVPDGATAQFGYTKSFDTDPVTDPTFTLADGEAEEFEGVLFGDGYTVTEDEIPEGWEFDSIDCSASVGFGEDDVEINLDGATITFDIDDESDLLDCTFLNKQERGAILVNKTRKHAASGSGDHAHADVTFTITGEDLAAEGVEVTTDANGEACYDGLLFGDYTVTETVPTGYSADDAEQDVTVDTESECGDDAEATVDFHNTPLTDVTVSVDSLVAGGTASTISCVDGEGTLVDDDLTNAAGDVELTIEDLLPTAPTATLVCTIVVDP